MTFGEKLLELRRKNAMSQDVLAEKLEVSRQAVSKWERDEAVPETDKIVRIARLFSVSTDYLLLDEPSPANTEPQQESPRQTPTPPAAPSGGATRRAEQFIRRHGYKGGYILIAWGAFICLICIGMRLLWPAIAGSFFGSVMDAAPNLDLWGSSGSGIITDSNGNALGTWDELFGDSPVTDENGNRYESLEDLLGTGYQDPFYQFEQSQKDTLSAALNAQANLFLIGLLPGGLLIAAGIFVVIKGKQLAKKEADIPAT